MLDKTHPFFKLPDADRLAMIRDMARKLPGAIASTPLMMLVDEIERLMARVEALEDVGIEEVNER